MATATATTTTMNNDNCNGNGSDSDNHVANGNDNASDKYDDDVNRGDNGPTMTRTSINPERPWLRAVLRQVLGLLFGPQSSCFHRRSVSTE